MLSFSAPMEREAGYKATVCKILDSREGMTMDYPLQTIAELLKTKRKAARLSVAEVAAHLQSYNIHLSPKTLYGYESGHSAPDLYTLLALCEIYGVTDIMAEFGLKGNAPQKNAGLLVTAEADQTIVRKLLALKTQRNKYRVEGSIDTYLCEEREALQPPRIAPYTMPPEEPQWVEMRVFHESAAAGMGNYLLGDAQNYEFMEFPSDSVPSQADFGIYISGDSMTPLIEDEQIVWVKAMPQIEDNEIGIFILNNRSYCKKIRIDYQNSCVWLLSLNPAYAPICIQSEDDFQTIGKVLLHGAAS